MNGRAKAPKTLYLHVTSRCNLSCRYCYLSGSYSEPPLEDWLALLQQAAENPPDKIVITGGEPLLYPHVFDIAGFCRRHMPGAFLCLMTNGTLVSEENARSFTVFDKVRLSIDGDEALTDSLRGEGCARSVRNALRVLRRENVKVAASATRVPESPPVDEIAQALIRQGFANIQIHPVKRIGRAGDYPPKPEDSARERSNAGCGAGMFLNIMPNGFAYPCHALMRPEFLLGVIPKDQYASICAKLAEWEQERFPRLFCGGCIGERMA
jgi:MoaA/NifB/PqqE/SkfB family radical SAM enzyme